MKLATACALAVTLSHDWPERLVRLIQKVLSHWFQPAGSWWL